MAKSPLAAAPSPATKQDEKASSAPPSDPAIDFDVMSEKLSLYQAAFEHLPVGICIFNQHSEMTVCNKQIKSLLNYPDELFANQLPKIEDLLRYDVKHDEALLGDHKPYLEYRLQQIFSRKPLKFERWPTNQKAIEVTWHPIADGGYILAATEVANPDGHDQELKTVLNSFPGGICIFDQHGKLAMCNEVWRQLTDHSGNELDHASFRVEDYVRRCAEKKDYGEGELSELVAGRLEVIKSGRLNRHEVADRRGAVREVTLLPLETGGFVETHIDVTEQRTRTLQLETVLENFPGGISVMDENLDFVLWNNEFKRLFDYPDELFADGAPSLEDIYYFNARRGEFGDGDIDRLVSDRLELASKFQPQDFECIRPDGRALEIRGTPIAGGNFLNTYTDITERLRQQTNAIRMANYNPVSGLPNRSLYEDRLTMAMAQAERGLMVAIHHFKLYGFSEISQRSGKQDTDNIIKTIGERLLQIKRDTDTIAHPGGEDFLAIQVGIDSKEGAEAFAKRILSTIREPVETRDCIYRVDANCGIAIAPDDGTFHVELQSKLALALYQSREHGPGKIQFADGCKQQRKA